MKNRDTVLSWGEMEEYKPETGNRYPPVVNISGNASLRRDIISLMQKEEEINYSNVLKLLKRNQKRNEQPKQPFGNIALQDLDENLKSVIAELNNLPLRPEIEGMPSYRLGDLCFYANQEVQNFMYDKAIKGLVIPKDSFAFALGRCVKDPNQLERYTQFALKDGCKNEPWKIIWPIQKALSSYEGVEKMSLNFYTRVVSYLIEQWDECDEFRDSKFYRRSQSNFGWQDMKKWWLLTALYILRGRKEYPDTFLLEDSEEAIFLSECCKKIKVKMPPFAAPEDLKDEVLEDNQTEMPSLNEVTKMYLEGKAEEHISSALGKLSSS